MYVILKSPIRKGGGEIIMKSKGKIIMDSDGKIVMDSKGKGLAVCGICLLIVAELYLKAPGWVIGWSIFTLFAALP